MALPMIPRLIRTFLCMVLLSACQGEAAQVLVHLRAEDGLMERAAAIEVLIFDNDGFIASDFRFQLAGDRPEAALPTTVPVSPRDGDASRTFSLRAVLLDADGDELAVQQVATGFVADSRRHITLVFTESCGPCANDERCLDGTCVTECADSSEAESADSSPPGECPILATCRTRRPTSISLGGTHACMVDESGELYCWGAGSGGRLGVGRELTGVQPTPMRVVSAVTENVPPTANEWTQVSVGESHASAVHAGSIFSWGNNANRRIGNGGFESMDGVACNTSCFEARRSANNITARQVQAGGEHALGISVEGSLFGWGNGRDGQLGSGTDRTNNGVANQVCRDTDDCSSLMVQSACASGDPIDPMDPMDRVGGFSCIINVLGELYCFGDNKRFQLGVTTASDAIQRVGESADWTQVACGEDFACGIRGGELHCWGANEGGKLGLPGGDDIETPARVGERDDWLHVSAGVDHACAIDAEGGLFCWGDNSQGALGSPGEGGPEMVRVEGVFSTASDVFLGRMRFDAGRNFTCALQEDIGRLLCWGLNDSGQLGRADTESRAPESVCFPR